MINTKLNDVFRCWNNSKTRILFGVILLIFCLGCNRERNEQLDYNICLEKLVMNYTSLDEISIYTNLTPESLIKEVQRIPPSIELTQTLNEMLTLFNSNYEREKQNILENRSDIAYKLEDKPILAINIESIQEYEFKSHEKFQKVIDDIIVQNINQEVEKFINDKFSILNIPNLIYTRAFYSREAILIRWEQDINKILSSNNLRYRIDNQIKSYAEYLTLKRKIYGIDREVKPPHITITEEYLIMPYSFEDHLIKRVNNELYSSLFLFIIEIIISCIIIAIIGKIYKKKIKERMGLHEVGNTFISNFFRNKRKTKSFFTFLNDTWRTVSQQKIKERYNKRCRRINWTITIIFFFLSFLLFDYESSKLERVIYEEILETYSHYLSKQNTYIEHEFNRETNTL